MSLDDQSPRDRLPPLNALRHFEAVARAGSFAAASVQLHVTHWAVAKQVRALEDWFGVALFERRPRGVVLTDEGAALLDDVGAAFERLASGAARMGERASAPRVSGTVRVNVLSSFAVHWLLPRLAGFHALYPGVEVRLSTSSRRLRYISEAVDLGVRSGEQAEAGVVSRRLMADLRVPVCSPELLRRRPIRTPADLASHTLLHSASTRASWAHWWREAGVPAPRSAQAMEFEHVYLQIAAAIEGLGVALASHPLVEREIAAGRLVSPLAGLAWRAPDYVLLVNAERAGDKAVAAFRRWIVATAQP